MKPYFSDREIGPRARTIEEITPTVWGGIVVMIRQRLTDGSFGYAYPETCPDNEYVCGCDARNLGLAAQAEVPNLLWPIQDDVVPMTFDVLDLLEFLYRAVAEPESWDFHSYFGHHHLNFDPQIGKQKFREDVNRLFARNGIAFELDADGLVTRLAPELIREILTNALFQTGDQETDRLLQNAREKFLRPNIDDRRESLEKLWDAWERLKTLETPDDKKASITSLLEKASPDPNFRMKLDSEAKELTAIGNLFRIRHSEITQTPLQASEHIDYLFHRLFALIYLLLATTNRLGAGLPTSKAATDETQDNKADF